MEDDSCTRAGSVPFKWEVCPGTPKHTRSASASAGAAAASAKVSPANKLTLTPPPSMAASYSYCSSPSPYYHHSSPPRVVSSARSASVSPLRRRPYAYGGHPRAPTAFIDATPQAAAAVATEYAGAPEADMAAAFGCFSLPMLRRKGSKKGGGSSSRSSSGSSSSGSSSAGSFRSDGELGRRMRRSASISSASSLPLPPGRRRYAEARAEVDAATGRGWFF